MSRTPQKALPREAPKEPPRRAPESSQNQFPGEPPKWPQTCSKLNQNPYDVYLMKTSKHFQDPPKAPPQRGPQRAPQKKPKIATKTNSQGNPPNGPNPVQNLTKILIGSSLLKTSRHFQDPPKSNPPREAPRATQKRPRIVSKPVSGGPPPTGPFLFKT